MGGSAESPEPARARGLVQSVDRALDVLETLAGAEVPLGVGEVARDVSLPQGTVHRLLRSLEQRGYVHQDAGRKYSIGTAALRLGDAAQRSLARGARPFLAELVELSGESANLAVLEGNDVVYVAQHPSPHSLRMFTEVGRHVTPHSTAVGKVLLAALPRDHADAVLRRTGLPGHTEHTVTDPGRLLAELEVTRDRGWGVDEEEQERGVRCVAVPVDQHGRVVAALSLSGPSGRFDGAATPGLVEKMTDIARRLSAQVLGGDVEED
ncbi:MAG TPA: IclR family transcriptional regulator [Nocardioidaceae bacterium]